MTSLSVPFLDLTRAVDPLRRQLDDAVTAVMDSMRFVLAGEGEALESECAARMDAAGAAGVASGTDALILAYKALEIKPGDEVITSPFSFFASAGAIVQAGATPRFADIDPCSYNIDPQAVEDAIGVRTRGICPVHLFGQTAAMDEIMTMATRHDLSVVEDAAQAIDAALHGRQAGALGHIAAFSFYPTKNLGGIGDGGLVTSTDAGLIQRVRLLRHHGQTGPYEHALVGTNSRLDEIQAAVLRVKLRHLQEWTADRRKVAAAYGERFAASALTVRNGGPLDGADLSLPHVGEGCHHVYNLYTVRARDREGLRQFLQENGIGCGVYYPLPLHLQPCFSGLGYKVGDFPEAEAASAQALSLPLYPGLRDSEIEAVVAAVVSFYGADGGGR